MVSWYLRKFSESNSLRQRILQFFNSSINLVKHQTIRRQKLFTNIIENCLKKVIIRFFIFSLQIFAAGSFELQILEISNDKSHLLSGYCCGSSSAINVKHQKTSNCPTCVTSFRLCLKEFQVTNMPKEQIGFFGCAYGNTTTPVLGGSSFVLQEPNIETIKLPFTFRWTVSIV